MNKDLVIAGILLSVSTVLKICSVVALVQVDIHHLDEEHDHHEPTTIQKKQLQTSEQPLI